MDVGSLPAHVQHPTAAKRAADSNRQDLSSGSAKGFRPSRIAFTPAPIAAQADVKATREGLGPTIMKIESRPAVFGSDA